MFAQVTCELRLSNPAVAAWKPPPKPAKTLAEIVPPREIDRSVPATTANDLFKSKVAGVHLWTTRPCVLLPAFGKIVPQRQIGLCVPATAANDLLKSIAAVPIT